MKAYRTIKADIIKLVEGKEKEMADLQSKLEQAKNAESAAVIKANAEKEAGNITGYDEAFKKADFARREQEVYLAKIESIEKEPLISQDEFNQLYEDVCVYLDSVVERDTASFVGILKELDALYQRHSAEIIDGNSLIEYAQRKALKDPCGVKNAKGVVIPMLSMVKKYKNLELNNALYFMLSYNWARKILDDIKTEGSTKE